MNTIKVTYIGGSMDGYSKTFEENEIVNGKLLRVHKIIDENRFNIKMASLTQLIEEYECKRWINPKGVNFWLAFYIGD